MFDCMEALGMGPRQLYDVTSRGACMLRKASPFFAGLDPFAWTGSASVQYSCKLTFDANTVHRFLKLADDKTIIRVNSDQLHPSHPDRFDSWPQVLCITGLKGRCYWEVDWSEKVDVAVSYREIRRRGDSGDGLFGENNVSWSLRCTNGQYSVCHNQKREVLPQTSSGSGRIAVYLDYSAGSLSYYSISNDKLNHIYTFKTTFTYPLFPGFAFCHWDSTVCLRFE